MQMGSFLYKDFYKTYYIFKYFHIQSEILSAEWKSNPYFYLIKKI